MPHFFRTGRRYRLTVLVEDVETIRTLVVEGTYLRPSTTELGVHEFHCGRNGIQSFRGDSIAAKEDLGPARWRR